MRIVEVVGRVTLSRMHPSLTGARFPIVLPMTLTALRDGAPDRGEELVAYDKLGVGPGDLVGLSEGGEAANPFGKVKTPVDAYCACLLDAISF
ncbi:EutN/CcmL family microcompartment protein [Paludisphaera mucosa]|uniref:EutN/CcmL family microcompartment protein n=1 Tax=Paludisphaera mucosa TaxID=3030827 RepID=A0ABT6FAR3_9BACT|nr:EutN/CcmL family microcompartment protein [Paludisphaera mucosa]MDG3004519.1 EutN/CcmL family microcompartment protein [Paludisphaera mucosa]